MNLHGERVAAHSLPNLTKPGDAATADEERRETDKQGATRQGSWRREDARAGMRGTYRMTIESSISSTPCLRSPVKRGGTESRMRVVRYEKDESGPAAAAGLLPLLLLPAVVDVRAFFLLGPAEDEATALLRLLADDDDVFLGADMLREGSESW
jgi:hypothetical protein